MAVEMKHLQAHLSRSAHVKVGVIADVERV